MNENPTDELFDRLPALYREEGGEILERLVGVVEELTGELRARARRREHRWLELAHRWRREADGSSAREDGGGAARGGPLLPEGAGAGTERDLLDWFDAVGEPRPEVWPGLFAEPAGSGRILFSRPGERRVVLAWFGRHPADPSELPPVPRSLVPVSCGVQTVWLARRPTPSPPFSGLRSRGRILDREGEARRESARSPRGGGGDGRS